MVFLWGKTFTESGGIKAVIYLFQEFVLYRYPIFLFALIAFSSQADAQELIQTNWDQGAGSASSNDLATEEGFDRLGGNPQWTSQPGSLRFTQFRYETAGGQRFEVLPVRDPGTALDYYNYTGSGVSVPYPVQECLKSQFFLYRNLMTGSVSWMFAVNINGRAADPCGGEIDASYTISGAPTLIFSDENGESTLTGFDHFWLNQWADGHVIEMDGPSFDISGTLDRHLNIREHVMVLDTNGSEASLDLSQLPQSFNIAGDLNGRLDSAVFDTGSVKNWGTISHVGNGSPGTRVRFFVRTGSDEATTLAAAWEGPFVDGESINNANTENAQFIQYRVVVRLTDPAMTATVQEVNYQIDEIKIGFDSDFDGIPDAREIDLGTKVDGADSDNDGLCDGIIDVPNVCVGGEDADAEQNSDADALIDALDEDDDNDSLLTKDELPNGNSDGDALDDYLDPDDDNDTIPTLIEVADSVTFGGDPDMDGKPAYLDIDSDGVQGDDETEGTGDDDMDGIPNYLDPVVGPNNDQDGDGIPDDEEGSEDFDGDGLANFEDIDSDGDGILDAVELRADPDMDGKPAYLDKDSDGDGVADAIEGHDLNGDGVADVVALGNDIDDDGLDDAFDPDQNGVTAPLPDHDNDQIEDYLDTDDDGDGIPTATEFADAALFGDPDGDGIPAYLDLDSDGEGEDDASEGTGDEDNDNVPNYLDPIDGPQGNDVDGDGIPDDVEGTEDFDGDGLANFEDIDSDGDGILDADEKLQDPDMDGKPAYLDLDSDGDGLSDAIEGHDDNGDGVADRTPVDKDTDGDGLDDAFDPDDAGTSATKPDHDEDTFEDYLDADDDDDMISTEIEVQDGIKFSPDVDGDGKPNYLDDDSDGDGKDDLSEGNGDSDMDGIPNYLDADDEDGPEGDADMDGLTNGRELELGTNPLNPDSDNDGLTDGVEVNGENPTDPNDEDSDKDGLKDGEEDTNKDGVFDAGETDPNDEDTDKGGINDGEEVERGTDPLDASDDIATDDTPTDALLLAGGQSACSSTQPGSNSLWLLLLAFVFTKPRKKK